MRFDIILLVMEEDYMIDIYVACPTLENDDFHLSIVSQANCSDLLKVYSDPLAIPFFNVDNCNGDDFHYTTIERMKDAIDFWIYSYNYRWFVRWAIIDKNTDEAIGTVECFHRESADDFNGVGLIRVDLRHDYENENCVSSIFKLIIHPFYRYFNCSKIITKGFDDSSGRTEALLKLGFIKSDIPLIGNNLEYYNYWAIQK